jgi:hypothetical protein
MGAEGTTSYHSTSGNLAGSSSFIVFTRYPKIPYPLFCNLRAKCFLLSRMELTTK